MATAGETTIGTPVSAGTTVDPAVLASKRVLFIGGLADEATSQLIRAALIPFGNIKSVDMPMDYVKGKHRGFAFVEFDDADDAEEAIYNMDGAELFGRTIQVIIAQANQIHKLTSAAGSSSEAIWKSDEWFQQYVGGQDEEARKAQERKEMDVNILKGK